MRRLALVWLVTMLALVLWAPRAQAQYQKCPAGSVMAGPTTGSPSAPACRPLFPSDIPNPSPFVSPFGGSCPTGDQTSALQAAINGAAGGTIVNPCPLNIAGVVHITQPVKISGTSALYFKGMLAQLPPTVWPPVAGSSINCTGTSGMGCLSVESQGVTIEDLNLGNPQPVPGASWSPTTYPPIITTVAASNWAGLVLRDLTFTSASYAIDLEGTPNYGTVGTAGSQFTIENVWCNPCINEGINLHLLDNTGDISNVEYDFWWNRSNPAVGAYIKTHSVGMTFSYAANTRLRGIEFYSNKIAIDQKNDTVTYSPGVFKTFAAANIQGTDISFNEVCQAMANESGSALLSSGRFANVTLYADTGDPAVNCPLTTPIAIDLSSTGGANWTMAPLTVGLVQTIADIGPNSTLHFDNVDVQGYSYFAAGGPAAKVSAGADFTWGANTLKAAIRPATGTCAYGACGTAGNVLGAGLDNTQGYEHSICVGGGTNAAEGAACLLGSQNGTNTGSITFYTPNGTQRGFAGNGSATGVNFKAKGSLKTFVGNENETVSFGDDGASHNLVNLNPLPTTPPSGTGAAYICVDNLGSLYVKASCP